MALSAPVATHAPDVRPHAEGSSPGFARQIRRWWAARTSRRAVAELTDGQLADAGIDRASVTGPMPVHVVEQGYHVNATGWR